MEQSILTVIIVDDDGLDCRKEVFRKYYEMEAKRQDKKLVLHIFTYFPNLAHFLHADIISWDNDLGPGGETIKHIRKHQFMAFDATHNLYKDTLHIIHSMNPVASDALYQVFTMDFDAQAQKIPFGWMAGLVISV